MKRAWGAILSGFAQVLSHIWTMLAVNIVTAVLSLPFAVVLAVPAIALHVPSGSLLFLDGILLLTLPTPTAAGIHLMMRDLAHGEPIHMSDWWDGLRSFGLPAFRAWCVGLVAFIVILANLAYYPRAH